MPWVLTVPEDRATGTLAEVYRKARERAGKVPNITTIQSLRPAATAAGFGLYCELMDAPTGLSKRERVLVATVVSKVNGCLYWMESHETDLRSEVGGEAAVAVQADYRAAGLAAREVALLDYAVKLTTDPRGVGRADLEALRGQGYSDEQVVDAVQCIGYINFINRVLDGLGVDPEPGMRYPGAGG